MKNVAFLTQRVDYLVKLRLELIGFQLLPEIKPAAEKAVAVCYPCLPEDVQSARFAWKSACFGGRYICPPPQSWLFSRTQSSRVTSFFSRLLFLRVHLFAFSKPFCAHSGKLLFIHDAKKIRAVKGGLSPRRTEKCSSRYGLAHWPARRSRRYTA